MSDNLTTELINNLTLQTIEQEDLQLLGDLTVSSIAEGAKVLSMLLNNNTTMTLSNI